MIDLAVCCWIYSLLQSCSILARVTAYQSVGLEDLTILDRYYIMSLVKAFVYYVEHLQRVVCNTPQLNFHYADLR